MSSEAIGLISKNSSAKYGTHLCELLVREDPECPLQTIQVIAIALDCLPEPEGRTFAEDTTYLVAGFKEIKQEVRWKMSSHSLTFIF